MENNPITQILSWIKKAVPSPTDRDINNQLGVHFEEVATMLDVLKDAGDTFQNREKITFGADVMRFLALQFKAFDDGVTLDIKKIDRILLLDTLCKQHVTSVGASYVLGLDVEGGLQEIADSNDSKFGVDGMPIFNKQLKVVKGPGYKKPNLTKFV
jgi:hypothetical protein